MKATIIIPTYSPNEYIYECIDAVIMEYHTIDNNTFPNPAAGLKWLS